MTNFEFLKTEWPDIFEAAVKVESAINTDPRTSCFYARRALELAMMWAYKYDSTLRLPYQQNLSALIHEPTFKNSAGEAIFSKARIITRMGNHAVHSHRPVHVTDAEVTARELFHFLYWLARTYGRTSRPAPDLDFDLAAIPQTVTVSKHSLAQLQELEKQLSDKDEKLSTLLIDNDSLDEELKRLRAEITAAKKAAAEKPDTHDYSEAETRDFFIDLMLKEAGWPLDKKRDREFEVAGMPNSQEKGFVDYVLWGNDGKPLALVEAKRTRRDARAGQQQAKLYADCLEQQFGRRPVIYYSNGYENWIWDDAFYPPRTVQGFHKKEELELLIQRRSSKRSLANAAIKKEIVDRFYQTRAIRRIGEAFEKDANRKALVVMATGAGKTRTVIALVDVLMRCNWAKRVLFLADRVALVNQAVNAFKKHLPDSSPVNLVTERNADGRVFVSTYPTMMGLIDETADGQRRFGVGHFDLVIIDEAHRSVFQKYRAIFEYFDSLLVGLTATPKDEVDRNTYGLFDLESGVPTDAYALSDAVGDHYLVPPNAVSVPLKYPREGIKYDELSEEDKDQWDEIEWDEEEGIPERVEAEAVNKWLFNKDTVDKVLAFLMERGLKVAGGDRLGKTIIFAKNQAHAEFIGERFNASYPHYRGEFARVITFKTEYAQSLIDDFTGKEKSPHIAISVDMLDTGIDVPEVVNLVFFKMVRSKTKFWQMIGRGTRLCPDLFGPRKNKENFFVFDFCGNLAYFGQEMPVTEGSVVEPLGKRLFKTRLALIGELDNPTLEALPDNRELRNSLAESLRSEVAAMNLENFVVRPKRRFIEKFADPAAWVDLSKVDHEDLMREVAGLPSEMEPEPEEAKRFDLLLLRTQLAILRSEPGFERLRDIIILLAEGLSEKSSIPMVSEHMELIQDVQSELWWQDVTLLMLETVRRKLRGLIHLIDRRPRKIIFTDVEDVMGEERSISLPEFGDSYDFEKFRIKAREFLRQHEDLVAVNKLRLNKQLTETDLAELERVLLENRIGNAFALEHAKNEAEGLGIFVRSLVGMDRAAAKATLGGFIAGKTLNANQIEFVNMIVDHLTEHGIMDATILYESPFTDIASRGPEDIFAAAEITELVKMLEDVRETAIAV